MIFAVVHAYWAAGGEAGMRGDPADSPAAQIYIGAIAALGLVGAALAYGLDDRRRTARCSRTLTLLARAGGAVLLLGVAFGTGRWLARWIRLLRDSIQFSAPALPRHVHQGKTAASRVFEDHLLGTGFGDRFKAFRGSSRRFEQGVRRAEGLAEQQGSALVSAGPAPFSHGKEGVDGSSPSEGFD